VDRAGKQLLYLDGTGFESVVSSLRAEVAAADRAICSQPAGAVLAIVDLRGAADAALIDVYRAFRQSVHETGPFVDRLAFVGLTGLSRVVAECVARISGSNVRMFDTRAEAIAWLVNNEIDGVIAIGPRHPWEPLPAF
jgi:hypothetical protein